MPTLDADRADKPPQMEATLPRAAVTPIRPIVKVKVVYLGSDPRMSLALSGSILEERFGTTEDGKPRVRRSITDTGNTPYDFMATDELGEIEEIRRMPQDHPIHEVRGKVFSYCEHPDHLYDFRRMRDPNKQLMFTLVGPDREAMQLLADYFERKDRRLRRTEQEDAEIYAGRPA